MEEKNVAVNNETAKLTTCVVEKRKFKAFIGKDGLWHSSRLRVKEWPKYEETFVEIPPFAIDTETGEILNKKPYPILKPGEVRNFYQEIQSYKQDCDIYSILAKYAATGDESLLNKGKLQYGDISSIPNNIAEFGELVRQNIEELKKLDPVKAKKILTGSNEDLNLIVQDIVKAELVKRGFNEDGTKIAISGGEEK